MTDYRDFYRNKRVLVTGGLGFIGSNLAVSLVELGAKVLIVDALIPQLGSNQFNVSEVKNKLTVDFSDIRAPSAMREKVVDKDVIFCLAGQVSHVDSMKEPVFDYDINVLGNLNVLEAVREFSPSAHIIYGGTRGQYGRVQHIPAVEEEKREPLDIYGVNKDTAERFYLMYHRLHQLKSSSLRIGNTYGPRHQMKHGKFGILNWFIRLALDNEEIKVFGDGSQKRDYNYVGDAVKALLMMGSSTDVFGEAFNLSSGSPMEFIELVRQVVGIAGSGRYRFTGWTGERKQIETGDFVADATKIRNRLGWQPVVTLDEGLQETVDFYRENKSHYW